jgi:hypothetical protein
VTDPHGGRAGDPRSTPQPRWMVVWLPLVVVVLVAVAVAALLLVDRRGGAAPGSAVSSVTGRPAPTSELEGEWTGDGDLSRCAGFDDEGCSGSRSIRLTIDCSAKRCAVTPFDRDYGAPPLRLEEGVYRAAGPVPPDVAPRCGGSPTHSALWRLEFVVWDGRLRGSYAESTIQGFDCGATGVAWDVALERG